MWIRLRDDLYSMDLFGIYSVGSISRDKVYKVVDSDDQCYSILDDNGKHIRLHKSYFNENTLVDLVKCETIEPVSLKSTQYYIQYSLDYAKGLDLVDISKENIVSIDGEIISKGRVWVIETERGTVIIPFKAIIHMHPQY